MIGDSLAASLPELRAQAESLMTATGQIGALEEVFVPAENAMIETLLPIYDGKMRVWHGKSSSVAEAGGQLVTTNPLLCSVPWDTTGIEVGMVVRVTASHDPDLVGLDLPVADVSRHEQSVRRLLTLIDNQG